MNRGFYLKMAAGNIRKNRSIYLPYLLAISLVIGLYYILSSVQMMVTASSMRGVRTMTAILNVCIPIAGGFSLVILFYVNSFVMKQRKKELGLYNILGMEKRHLGRMMVIEVLLAAAASLLAGIFGGALFSQLMFLIFYKMVKMPVALEFAIPLGAVGGTAKLFGIGFVLVMVYDVFSVFRTNPILLLQESQQGEREPKTRYVLTIVGLVTLGCGYWIAQSAASPMEAMESFFIAAVLVIIGTYCLFMAVTVAILKFLKKRERFFYRPANFITLSGMIYRMKQNAVGLASICVLSTTVMATIASSLSMFLGLNDSIRSEYIRRVEVTSLVDDTLEYPDQLMRKAAREHGEKYGVAIKNELGYVALSAVFSLRDSKWETIYSNYESDDDISGLSIFHFLLEEDYEAATGVELNLEKGEIAVSESQEGKLGDTLELIGLTYQIKERVPAMEDSDMMGLDFIKGKIQVIFRDMEELENFRQVYEKIYREYYGILPSEEGNRINLTYYYFFDVDGTAEELKGFYDTMQEAFQIVPGLSKVSTMDEIQEEYYQNYGTVLFVGVFLAAMFLIATVLIIYYKQITEGYDDRKRFRIMQQVGMSGKEVKATIRRQVLQVFFLPLILAVVHIAFAFKAMLAMLSLFGVYNKGLFAWCVVMTAAVFGLMYLVVYLFTARTYYKIVKV